MRLDNFLNEEEDIEVMLEYIMLMEEIDNLNESTEFEKGGMADKINTMLGKLGLHAHGSKKGIMHSLAKAGKHVGALLWHAMKAMKGNEESKKKVKEIANKEVKKEDVIDFLLKLDVLTMHLFTGPIHMIDAITGWHIGPKLENKTKDLRHRVDRALTHLEKIKDEVAKPVAKKVAQYIAGLKKTFIKDEKK